MHIERDTSGCRDDKIHPRTMTIRRETTYLPADFHVNVSKFKLDGFERILKFHLILKLYVIKHSINIHNRPDRRSMWPLCPRNRADTAPLANYSRQICIRLNGV